VDGPRVPCPAVFGRAREVAGHSVRTGLPAPTGHVRCRRLSRRNTVGKHDREDKDEASQGDGFVGWMPSKPVPGKHATDDEEDQPQDQNEDEE